MRNLILLVLLCLNLYIFGIDNRSIFNNIKEYKQIHSNWFPIKINEREYMTDYMNLVFMLCTDYGLSISDNCVDSLVEICRNRHIPLYSSLLPEEYGLLVVEKPDSIYSVEDILNKYVDRDGYILPWQFDNSFREGDVLYSLYVNHIAVQTDCMTGYKYIPYVETANKGFVKINPSGNLSVRGVSKHKHSEAFEYIPITINGRVYMSRQKNINDFFSEEYKCLIPGYYEKFTGFIYNNGISLYSKGNPEDYGLIIVHNNELIDNEFTCDMIGAKSRYLKMIKSHDCYERLRRERKLGSVLYNLFVWE